MKSSLIGRTLGKYEITGLLGHGGMSTVYKGYQQDIDRYAAIKVLPPHPGQDEQFIERFKLEARTIARLQHPHILPVYDYGNEGDVLFLAIAYIEGGSLSDRIDRGPMSLSDVERLVRQIAGALDYAHRQGVIHRDIKPDNILLDSDGNARLADFGIAKLVEGDSRLTATGGLIGTPAYMAPEQAQGLDISPAADIYSLGVVVYEMLSGQQPYKADSPMQLALRHITEPTPRITAARSGLPPALERVMLRVMAKNPRDRYVSAAAFADDFGKAIRMTSEADLIHEPELAQTLLFDTPSTMVNNPPTTTIIQQAGGKSVLLVGLGIIALLVVVIMVLVLSVLNQDTSTSVVSNPTEAAEPTVAVTVAPTAVPVPTFGRLSFGTASGNGDSVNLRVEKLRPVTQGMSYMAWLQSTDGEMVMLGALNLDALGNGLLTYTDPDSRVLPAFYNTVLITLEERMSDNPQGNVVYSGSVPPEVSHALREILVESEQGFRGGSLLAGALDEARIGAEHAGYAASARNPGGMHTHAEHTLNILLGTETDYDNNGRGENPGRQLGILYFMDLIEEHLDNILDAPGATRALQLDGELIRVCLGNVRVWTDQVIRLQEALVLAESVEAVAAEAAEAVEVATTITSGVDLNENGVIDPFEGECGLQQIATYGVLFGSLDILEGVSESADA